MLKLFALALAGAIGTLARYWVSGFVHRHTREAFPLGTLVVNLIGCFLIGFVMYMVREHERFGPETRVIIVVGLLGGFTTFSAFGYETLELLRGGAFWPAALNACANVLLGIFSVWVGSVVGRALQF
jgi:fluoride exporter